MSLNARIGAALRRIATVSNIVRSREQDAARAARDGGDDTEMRRRLEAVVQRLESTADDLERVI